MYKRALHQLRRRFGITGYLYRLDSEATNLQTGVVSRIFKRYQLNRMVMLSNHDIPSAFYRGFDTIFKRGGNILMAERMFYVFDLKPQIHDLILYDDQRYEVKEVYSNHPHFGHVVLTESVSNSVEGTIIDMTTIYTQTSTPNTVAVNILSVSPRPSMTPVIQIQVNVLTLDSLAYPPTLR